MRRLRLATVIALAATSGVITLLAWSSPIAPRAWHAPPRVAHVAPTTIPLDAVTVAHLELGGRRGPETLAMLPDGSIATGTACGTILRIDRNTGAAAPLAETGGRPLGLAAHGDGALTVADAMRGVLRIDPDGTVRTLVDAATPMPDGVPLGFANSVAIMPDGAVVFTDASSRFAPRELGLDDAVFLDLLEHGGHGRVLRIDPQDGALRILRAGLHFPNGIAPVHDDGSLLVVETGMYRVLRLHLEGRRAGDIEELVASLSSFPDNITPGADGRYWVGLVTTRSTAFDRLAPWPLLRRPLAHLPRRLRSTPRSRGSAIAIDESGRIVAALVDDTGALPNVTAVLEADGTLFVGTLDAPTIGRAGVRSHADIDGAPDRHQP